MEAKGMESANTLRAAANYAASPAALSSTSSANANGNENAWWRWTHGKSGSVSSSSDGAAAAYSYSPMATTSHSASSDAASSLPTWDSAPRWQKRTTRTGVASRDDASAVASPPLGSSSPKFAAAATSSSLPCSNGSARGAASVIAKKKMVQTSIRTARDVSVKKRFSVPMASGFHDFSLGTPAKDSRTQTPAASHDRTSSSDIKWTLGPGKRKVVKKDKKLGRGGSLQQSRSALNGVSHRPIRSWLNDGHLSDDETFNGLHVDVDMLEEKSMRCYSPTSTASTISSSASEASAAASSVLAQTRFVKSCALAIIEDCYREQQGGQYTRKRKLEGRPKVDDGFDFEAITWTHGLSKSPGGCGFSSSDEELCHRSSSVASHRSDGKTGRDFDENLTEEEITRRMLLGHRTLGSSSSLDSSDMLRLSPPSEAQGLPWNIRRRLPVKAGTADETDKECPICQALYGIGDQILRLPCEHFFHASCVDEWMKHHTSCPLCRTNVLDTDVEEFIFKHKVTDKEAIKRIRPPQTIDFRPVEPEVDQLQSHLADMAIGQEDDDKCLVCPTPTRPQRK